MIMCKGELRNQRFLSIAALGLAACASSTIDPATPETSSSAVDAPAVRGQFISRVLPTGETAPIDPIMAPGGVAPHMHVFFGAENVMATSTRTQLAAQPTTAQNPKDTAAYWVPQLYFNGAPWNPGCTGSPPGLACGSDAKTTYYLRVYYTTADAPSTVQMPRVMMVTGYPTATADPHLTDPSSLKRVHYTCGGEGPGSTAETPQSTWPYSCTSFHHPSFDGVVMIVDFPECWNGNVSGRLNGERVVQYIDANVATGAANDLVYATGATCPADHPFRIPHVSLRVHTLIDNPSSDGSAIWPSDCTHSTFPCQTQSEPPSSGPGSEGLGLASDAGTPGGWYTMHADFVQSWHMGAVDDPFSTLPPPNQDNPERLGTLNDLTEDCLIAGMTCGFQPDGTGCFVGN
jgi:Domain of unknown function (DUF1996)